MIDGRYLSKIMNALCHAMLRGTAKQCAMHYQQALYCMVAHRDSTARRHGDTTCLPETES